MIHGNNLNAIGQFAIEQPVRKRINPAATDGRFKDRPPLGILANVFTSFPNGIQKMSSNTPLSFVIKICCFGQFQLRDGEPGQPFHFTFRYASFKTSAESRSVNCPASKARQRSRASRFQAASTSGEPSAGSMLKSNFSTNVARSFAGNESASINTVSVLALIFSGARRPVVLFRLARRLPLPGALHRRHLWRQIRL
jgi:hypothetical protein